jgi:hypothetical protein
MLGQLVCVDRRYQRMNCFNIREAQSLLRKRFFTDLINPHDQRQFLNKTIIGVKHALNTDELNVSTLQNFYSHGLFANRKLNQTSYSS